MISKTTVFIVVFILFSCQNKIDKSMYYLSKGSEKYWILNEFTSKGGVSRSEDKLVLKFGKTGYFKQYNKENNNLYTGQKKSDIIQSDRWFFVNDSIINLNDYEYTIIKLNNETLKLRQNYTGNQFLYNHASNNQMSKFRVR